MITVLWIISACILVLLNALFVAAEFSMVRLRRTKIKILEKDYGIRGRVLSKIHNQLDAYLSACQVGITLASLGLGWVGEPAFTNLLTPLFNMLELSESTSRIISLVFSFSIISFLHIVIGELMPKSLAIRQSVLVSLWTAIPLCIFYWAMSPVIWLLNHCSNYFLKVLELEKTHEGENYYSIEEIKLVLKASHLHGELTQTEAKILEKTLDFADLKTVDIMRPIKEMVALNINHSTKDLLKKVSEKFYSRYPIYNNEDQKIEGVVHIKDLYAAFYEKKVIQNLEPFVRPALKISYDFPVIDLLEKFRQGSTHFALVYAEENNLIGFVTLDNVLHVIIGKIKDEFNKTPNK